MEPTNVIESNPVLVQELLSRYGEDLLYQEVTKDNIPTLWFSKDRILDVLGFLRDEIAQPFRTLYDLTAVDERMRRNRQSLPPSDFTVVYTLLSYERNADIRLKVPLIGESPSLPSATRVFPAANWYEREVWDMFGVRFDGHPHLARILMPLYWVGHPLRKEYPARATEMGPFTLPDEKQDFQQEILQFKPETWGLQKKGEDTDFIFLNLGPQHPGTHGVLRLVLQMSGEEVLDAVPEIGFHHRGAEKIGERQTWHRYIPYTDRVDYLGGVMNNFPYVMAVEKLAGIQVPERAQVIRVMMAEFFRLSSHLVWYGTFAQDVGQLSPVFYMFTDREKVLEFVAAVTGFRMHPAWYRIGGVAADLPNGWDRLVREFIDYFPKRLDDYNRLVMDNKIFQARTKGVGAYTLDQAIEWGVTGPNLRACGMEWDFRKKRPYSMYDQFDFDIPTATHGDCYDRAVVRVEEMRQSVRIIEQCLNNMPSGPYKSDNPLATPPRKPNTMHDIETLIDHFLGVSWGPVIPAGEALVEVEATKGNNGYHLISDGGAESYRTRIRTPSFAHMQTVPFLCQGTLIADVLAILGSIDFVLADVDR